MRRSKTALIATVLATGAAASVGWALQGSGFVPGASASARSPRLMLRHGKDYVEMKEYDRALEFLLEADARRSELTDVERSELAQTIDLARRRSREMIAADSASTRGNTRQAASSIRPGAIAVGASSGNAIDSPAPRDDVRLATASSEEIEPGTLPELPAAPPIGQPADSTRETRDGGPSAPPVAIATGNPSLDRNSPNTNVNANAPANDPSMTLPPLPAESNPVGLMNNGPALPTLPEDVVKPANDLKVAAPAADIPRTENPQNNGPVLPTLPEDVVAPANVAKAETPKVVETTLPPLPDDPPVPVSRDAVVVEQPSAAQPADVKFPEPAQPPALVDPAPAANLEPIQPANPTTTTAPKSVASSRVDGIEPSKSDRPAALPYELPPAPAAEDIQPAPAVPSARIETPSSSPSNASATNESLPALPPLPESMTNVDSKETPTSKYASDFRSNLSPNTRREVERIARLQDDEARRKGFQVPDGPAVDGSPMGTSTRLELPRPPSPTEARPIRPIPVPEEFTSLGPRVWAPNRKYWAAAATCHMPLYFQDPVLERYGQSVEQSAGPLGRFLTYPLDDPRQSKARNQIFQPFVSIGTFAAQIVALPYNLIVDPPWEAEYDLGYYRPGDPIPPDTAYFPWLGVGPPLKGKRY